MQKALSRCLLGALFCASALGGAALPAISADPPAATLSGAAAFGDWTADRPDLRRHIAPGDLPAPYATKSSANGPDIVRRPEGALPQVPPGFKVEEFASGLDAPRLLRVAPNGDLFVAETDHGSIVVLRQDAARHVARVDYAAKLSGPFGLAFYPPGPQPQYLYVGTTSAVLRYPYQNGDVAPRGEPEPIVPTLPVGGHWTRDVLFTADGRHLYVSVGSFSNDQEGGGFREDRRADILELTPDGGNERRFATGLRNPVGLALHPATGELWTAVNERDGLGDNLPPDYVTRVHDGEFFGWPWYYIGAHIDPRHQGEHPELRDHIALPDVLLQPHSAPLQLAVYTGAQFPARYRNDIFVALHGSWNRSRSTGYKVVRIPLKDGKPSGDYEDFMTGFAVAGNHVWGRPVGLAVAPDGALLVSDDASGTIWRVSYVGKR
jgi:glucose/arabinose dehydrogenase